jgi:hypothetical protein
MIRATVAVLAGAFLVSGCGSSAPSAAPATVTVTAPAPVAPVPTRQAAAQVAPSSATPTEVTLPAVKGRNGGIVYDELHELGLTKVELASADKQHTVVVLPQNWTAVKIEPAAGSKVRSNQTVVVTMTKD